MTADFFFPSHSMQGEASVEFLKRLNESTSFVISQRSHRRVECLWWKEVTRLIPTDEFIWHEEVNLDSESGEIYNNTLWRIWINLFHIFI